MAPTARPATLRASLTQGHKAGCDTLTCFSPAGSRAPLPPAEPGRQASARRAADAWAACTPREGPDGGQPRSAATGDRGRALTSAGRLGKAGAMPFSALTLPELLLGELGAEPGALLHESAGERRREPRAPPPRTPLRSRVRWARCHSCSSSEFRGDLKRQKGEPCALPSVPRARAPNTRPAAGTRALARLRRPPDSACAGGRTAGGSRDPHSTRGAHTRPSPGRGGHGRPALLMGTRLAVTEERKVPWPLRLGPAEPPDAAGARDTVLTWGLAAQVFSLV